MASMSPRGQWVNVWMSNDIPLFYVNTYTYTCPKLDAGLANLASLWKIWYFD